jgi:O-antigen ligase
MNERLTFSYGTAAQAVVARELALRQKAVEVEAPAAPAEEPVARDWDRDADWGFRGLMLFTFVLFMRPQDHFPFLNPLHLAELSAVLALGGMAFRRIRLGLPVAPLLPEVGGVVALGLVMFATLPFSIWRSGALETITDLYLKALLIFVLMLHAIATPRRLEQFVELILVCCAYLAFRAILDYARGVNVTAYGRVYGTVGGIFGNPNDLAMNLVTFFPLALAGLVAPLRTWKRLFCAGLVITLLGAIVATQSRAGFLGLVAVLVLAGIWLGRRRPGMIGAALVAAMLAVPFVPSAYWERMASIGNKDQDQTGSFEARQTVMREAFQAFLDRPLTGVGAGQFSNYAPEGRVESWHESHNVVLQIAADLGIFGLLIFLFLIWRGFGAVRSSHRMLRIMRRHPDRALIPLRRLEHQTLELFVGAVGIALAGWFVCAQFASIAYNWTFYYILALTIVPREIIRARLR